MDDQNYVQDNGDGTYSVVIGGKTLPLPAMNKSTAENVYNRNMGLPNNNSGGFLQDFGSSGGNGPGTPGYSPSAGGSYGDISDILRAIAESNQINFEEKKRQFNETMAWEKEKFGRTQGFDEHKWAQQYNLAVRQFNEGMRQFNQDLRVKTAMGLAQTGAQLKGPNDPLAYAGFSNSAPSIYELAGGGKPAAAFGALGTSQPNTIQSLLNQLGIQGGGDMGEYAPLPEVPEYPAKPPPTAANTDDAALDWIWQNRQDIADNMSKNKNFDVSTPEGRRAALRFFMQFNVKDQTPSQWAGSMGWKPVIAPPKDGSPIPPDTNGITGGKAFPMATQTPIEGSLPAGTPTHGFGGPMGVGATGESYQPTYKQSLINGAYSNPTSQGAQQILSNLGLGGPIGSGYKLPSKETLPPGQQIGGGINPDHYNPLPLREPPNPIPGWDFVNPYGYNQLPQITTQSGPGDTYTGRITSGPNDTGVPPTFTGPEPTPGGDMMRIRPLPPSSARPPAPNGIDQSIWDALGPTAQALYYQRGGSLINSPWQMNPGVWDSLNDSGKQAILSYAEHGFSPTGAWNANDYLRQLNASRPKGTAPRKVGYDWGRSQPLF